MYLLITMATCDSHRLCRAHNTIACLTPIPINNTKPIRTSWGPIKGIDVVELLEVCLGMFHVSFVDKSTTDLVGCSD